MVKKRALTTKKNDTPSLPKMGGKDIIGQKPLIPKVNNNFLYGGLGLAILIGGGVLLRNPALLSMLPGQKPPMPPATVTAPGQVQPGAAVTITGAFNPPVPQAFYTVTDQQGNQVTSGSLGQNVSQFSQVIPGANLNNGTYTVTVSDQPAPSPGPQGPGTVFPTAGALQQGLVNNQLGPSQSGPESISLS